MVNKLSIKTLGITFLILLAVVGGYLIYDSEHGESSFRENIVSVDTASVTSINIFPKSFPHTEVKIYKAGSSWKMNLENGKTVDVPFPKVQELLIELTSIKPLSVAAQSADKWSEFNVDSKGTKVQVFEGNKITADLIIGKFTYQQPSSMTTYIRVLGDNNVYAVNGFLEFSFNHNADYFRDDNVIKDGYANWTKLTFTYPGDSSYQLVNSAGFWEINGKNVDSAKVFSYLSSLSNLSIPNFINNPAPSLLKQAEYNLSIQSSSLGIINVSAYVDSTEIAITSSLRKDTYFDGRKADAWKRIFTERNSFFKDKKK
jgi:filamentous hemagglutinin family protein